jgi:hypothetical protein
LDAGLRFVGSLTLIADPVPEVLIEEIEQQLEQWPMFGMGPQQWSHITSIGQVRRLEERLVTEESRGQS